MDVSPRDALRMLEGSILTEVVFIHDFLQLVFDNDRFTTRTWPDVERGGRRISHGDDGYRDALCDLIGQAVTHTSDDARLVIGLGSTEVVTDLAGPATGGELAELYVMHHGDDLEEARATWRPGEDR